MTVAQEAPRAISPKRRRDAAAAYIVERYGIPCSPKTLAKLACLGGGPAFYKAGRIPLYADADLDAWACAKLSPRLTSTSQLAA
ncbi:hypothetical protein ACSD7O_07180 [Methylorubrum extorquens]|uniref:hypothetical protein n=1 Tax=Methylorubrum extorquens TaxID=408 RepID=UPI003F60B6E5